MYVEARDLLLMLPEPIKSLPRMLARSPRPHSTLEWYFLSGPIFTPPDHQPSSMQTTLPRSVQASSSPALVTISGTLMARESGVLTVRLLE